MSRILYIIGNGFDLAHNLPTQYCNFKDFVRNNNGELYEFLNTIPNIGTDWNNFEDALANIRFENFQELPSYSGDRERDDILDEYTHALQQLFEDWINTISIVCKEIFSIEKEKSYFLTFNYTETLEKAYGISEAQVYHIHNKRAQNQGVYSQYIFGHSAPDNFINQIPNRNYSGESSSFYEGVRRLNKHCDLQISSLEFQKLIDIYKHSSKVIVICHGLGTADKAYFQELYKNNTTIKWYYYGHNTVKKYEEYRKRIIDFNIPMEIIDCSELTQKE